MEKKYIVMEMKGLEFAIIFPEYILHKQMKIFGSRVVSAGFVRFFFEDGKIRVECRGKSISLNVASRPEDSEIVFKTLFG